jgi:hypothetical protein
MNPLMQKATALEDEKQRLRSQVVDLEKKVRDSVSLVQPVKESNEVPTLQREIGELRLRIAESEKMRIALDEMLERKTFEFANERCQWQDEHESLVAMQQRKDERKGKEKVLLDEVKTLREQLEHAQAQLALGATSGGPVIPSSPARSARAREIAAAEARIRQQEEEHGKARMQLSSIRVEREDEEKSTVSVSNQSEVRVDDASVELVGQLAQGLSELNLELEDPFVASILSTLSDITRTRTKKFGATVKSTMNQLSGRVREERARMILTKLLKAVGIVAVEAGWADEEVAIAAVPAAEISSEVPLSTTNVEGSCVACADRQCGRFRPHAFKKNQCRMCYHPADQHSGEPFGPIFDESEQGASPRAEVSPLGSSTKLGLSRMRSSVQIPRDGKEEAVSGARSPRERSVIARKKSWVDVSSGKLIRENGSIDTSELAARADDPSFVLESALLKEIVGQLRALEQFREESKAAKMALAELRDASSKEAASVAMESFKMREQSTNMRAREEEARAKLIELSMEATVTKDELVKRNAELEEGKQVVAELSDQFSQKEAELANTEALRFAALTEGKQLREEMSRLTTRLEDLEDELENSLQAKKIEIDAARKAGIASAESEHAQQIVILRDGFAVDRVRLEQERNTAVEQLSDEIVKFSSRKEFAMRASAKQLEDLKKLHEEAAGIWAKELADAKVKLEGERIESEKLLAEEAVKFQGLAVAQEKSWLDANTTQMKLLMEENEAALNLLRKSVEEKEKNVMEEHAHQVELLKKEHEGLSKSMTDEHAKQVALLRSEHVVEVEQLKTSVAQKEIGMESDHVKVVEALKKDFAEQLEVLKKEKEEIGLSVASEMDMLKKSAVDQERVLIETHNEQMKGLRESVSKMEEQHKKQVQSLRDELALQTARLQLEGGAAVNAVSEQLEQTKKTAAENEKSMAEKNAIHVQSLKKEHDVAIETLHKSFLEKEKSVLDAHADKVESVRKEHLSVAAALQSELELQKKSLVEAKRAFDAELESLRGRERSVVAEHANELELLRKKGVDDQSLFARQVEVLQKDHVDAVEVVKKTYEENQARKVKEHAVEIEGLQKSYLQKESAMGISHAAVVAGLQSELAVQTLRLQQEGGAAVKALSEEIELVKKRAAEKEKQVLDDGAKKLEILKLENAADVAKLTKEHEGAVMSLKGEIELLMQGSLKAANAHAAKLEMLQASAAEREKVAATEHAMQVETVRKESDVQLATQSAALRDEFAAQKLFLEQEARFAVKMLSEEVEGLKMDVFEKNRSLEAVKLEHSAAIDSFVDERAKTLKENDAALELLRKSVEEKEKNVMEEHAHQVELLKKEHEGLSKSMTDEHAKQMALLRSEHVVEVEQLKTSLEAEKGTNFVLNNTYAAEVSVANEKENFFAKQIEELKVEVNRLSDERNNALLEIQSAKELLTREKEQHDVAREISVNEETSRMKSEIAKLQNEVPRENKCLIFCFLF